MPRTTVGRAVRAGRLPFLTASVLPSAVGAAMGGGDGSAGLGAVGVLAVAMGHLSANLMNDVGDAATGVDAIDGRHFGFFGGSKLIQWGVVPARTYLAASLLAACACMAAVGMLAWTHQDVLPLAAAGGAVLLAWAYSTGPAPLSYRCGGEATVFLLFGPVATLAGHYAATGRLWSTEAALASLPLGLMTAGILIANEVPDAAEDAVAGKRNLVGLLGARRGWALYLVVVIAAVALAGVAVARAGLAPFGWAAMAALLPAGLAARVLKRCCHDKPRLVRGAALAILAQTWMGLSLLAGAMLK
jgi:1,4-dihydroxy-2-naphthoate octaprenyltransferase